MRFSLFNQQQADTPNREEEISPPKQSFLTSLRNCLRKTNELFNNRIDALLLGKPPLKHDLMEELEEILISADLGVKTTHKLLEQVQTNIKRGETNKPEVVKKYLRDAIYHVLLPCSYPLEFPESTPFTIMVIGVNGTGKTTTIAKIAYHFRSLGKEVLLVASDTFRAAAIEQLKLLSQRIGCDCISQAPGSDPSAVVYDAMKTSLKRGCDVVLIDTAGRMHTRVNLIEELKKIKRVMGKAFPGAPHEILLVIDATTGQNALSQAHQFQVALEVTGIVLTKLDGTSKGGILVAIADELRTPIRYLGIGEQLHDLKLFHAEEFAHALLPIP